MVNVAASILFFLLLLGITEAALRVYAKVTSVDVCSLNAFKKGSANGFFQVSSNPRLGIELRPGAAINSQSANWNDLNFSNGALSVNINSDGMRENREYAIPKPPNTYRIAVVGDSVAFGWGVFANYSYPKLLENALQGQWHDKNVEVLNFSVPGYNGEQKLAVLQDKVLKYEPDLVILSWLIDDDGEPTYFRSLPLMPGFLFKFLNEDSYLFSCFRERIVRRITALNSVPYKERYRENGSGWKTSKKLFSEVAAFSREKNLPVLVVITPVWQTEEKNADDGIIAIQQLLEKMATGSGLYALNLQPIVKNIKGPIYGYTVDITDIYHPNFAGHALMLPYIYNYLVENKLIPPLPTISGVKIDR